MDNETKIREELYKKMENNFDNFINELKNSEKEVILNSAYKITNYEDILGLFNPDNKKFDYDMIKYLHQKDNPLNEVYAMWQDYASSGIDEIEFAINDGYKLRMQAEKEANYKTFNVEVNLNGKFIIEVKAESQEQAKAMAQELLKDKSVKEALTAYKNNLKIDSKIHKPKTRDER